ncbi:unnamed protein product [Oncorhynchus mykiss]|uniref:TIR domain-containing protein n=1 Tax=Oncorhynchus mykiss TaxID=8022 RepID=A0A060YS23_ONCMY|nr:unnamed protein product [Oncorhynchus mykiss]
MIDLSDSSFWQMKQLRNLELGHNMLSPVLKATSNLPTWDVLDLSFNRINQLECSDFANKTGLTQLFLHKNKIPQFESSAKIRIIHNRLKVLNIGTNQMLALSDAFKNGFQKLEILDLRGNKLTYNHSRNCFYSKNEISSFRRLFLPISQTETRARVFRGRTRLTSLSISSNHIKHETHDKLNPPPFYHLTSLKILYVFSQRMDNKPSNFLEGLECLSEFRAGYLNIKSLHSDTFIHTLQLRYLDISNNVFSLQSCFSNAKNQQTISVQISTSGASARAGGAAGLEAVSATPGLHRDFQPGKPIIENITDAIYGSRKTICVISCHCLESEWCSREIQVASFRLFDEQKDVLILVFLEEIADQQLSPYHRMRRLLKRQTYLSWPRAGEYTGVFWQKLRVALETRDCPAEQNPILTGVERW